MALQTLSDLVARRYSWAPEIERSQAVSAIRMHAKNWDQGDAEFTREAARRSVLQQVAAHTMSVEEAFRVLSEEPGVIGYLMQDSRLERAWRDALKAFQDVFRSGVTP